MEQNPETGDQTVSPTSKRMIKVPSPGQMRGEGEWESFEEFYHKAQLTKDESDKYWKELQLTKYLPTKVIK